VALVETDLTVETLAAAALDRVLKAIDAGVPAGFQKLAAPVDRQVAATAMGMERPDSVKETWLSNALWQRCSPGGGNRDPARRGRPDLRDAPRRFAEPGQDDRRRVPDGAEATVVVILPRWRRCQLRAFC